MDPFTNFVLWLADRVELQLRYLLTMGALRAEQVWIELQLIWVDIKLACRRRAGNEDSM